MSLTICTFNVNNLYARYRFGSTFPGDQSGKSKTGDEGLGYLPLNENGQLELFAPVQRKLAAAALSRGTLGGGASRLPDVVCLQEVESLLALRNFNDVFLGGYYKNALLIDSHDFRQIDVGILSRREIFSVRTHVDMRDASLPDDFLFSRDCLEVTLPFRDTTLTLFVNHLKSKFAKSQAERQRGDAKRARQAAAVMDLVRARFAGAKFDQRFFAVVGDCNDEPGSGTMDALVASSGLTDVMRRVPVESDRWTYWFRGGNSVSQIDYLLLSPALDDATAGVLPVVERRGISFARYLSDGLPGPRVTHFHRRDGDPDPVAIPFQFSRFPDVTVTDYASDHCPVFLEIPE